MEKIKKKTHKRHDSAELLRTKERLQHLLTFNPAIIYSCEPSGEYRATFVSENIFPQLGYTAEEFLSDPHFWPDHIHPADKERVFSELVNLPKEDRHVNEYRFLHKNGTYRWMHDELRLVRDSKGVPREVVGYWIDITERKQAEEELRESDDKYRAVFDEARDGIVIIDRETGSIVDGNPEFEKQTGRNLDQLKKVKIWELRPPGKVEAARAKFLEIKEKGTGGSAELEFQKPDGEIVFVDFLSKVIKIRDTYYIQSLSRDITGKKNAEEALTESEKKYRKLHQSMMDGFVFVDMSGRIVEYNESYRTMLGYNAGEISLLTYKDVTPEKWHRFEQRIVEEQVLPRGYSDVYEKEYRKKDGTVFPVELRTFLIRNDDGGNAGMWAIVRDISGRKQAEDALRRARDEMETRVQERTSDLVKANERLQAEIAERKAMERNILISNELLKLLSAISSRKEYLDTVVRLIRDWSECRCAGIRIVREDGGIPYESYDGFSRKFWEAENRMTLQKNQCACTRVMARTPDPQDGPLMTAFGSFCSNNFGRFLAALTEDEKAGYHDECLGSGFMTMAVVPVLYGGNVVAAVHIADEREGMAPRKFIELLESVTPLIGEAIHKLDVEEEQMRLFAAIESAVDATVITDTDRTIQYVNPAFERITGYMKSEVTGKSLDILRSGKHDETFYDGVWHTARQGTAWSGRMTSRKKDGTHYEEDVSISPVRDASGALRNYVVIKRDVTEKIRLESISQAVDTMNNIGYIISGVRHEIGNPVNSIGMNLGLLKTKLGQSDKATVEKYVDRALDEVSKIEFLLQSLRSFTMYENPKIGSVLMSDFMGKFLPLVRSDFKARGIDVTASIDPDIKDCRADPRALQQILLNLFTNAADACEGRENPSISVRVMNMAGRVLVRVEDNGWGMTAEQQKNLFKPFHTSKAKGTGLGLVIVKKMMTSMNGAVEIESRKNVGTTVDLYLPQKEP